MLVFLWPAVVTAAFVSPLLRCCGCFFLFFSDSAAAAAAVAAFSCVVRFLSHETGGGGATNMCRHERVGEFPRPDTIVPFVPGVGSGT